MPRYVTTFSLARATTFRKKYARLCEMSGWPIPARRGRCTTVRRLRLFLACSQLSMKSCQGVAESWSSGRVIAPQLRPAIKVHFARHGSMHTQSHLHSYPLLCHTLASLCPLRHLRLYSWHNRAKQAWRLSDRACSFLPAPKRIVACQDASWCICASSQQVSRSHVRL